MPTVTYSPISTTLLTSNATTVVFSSIPQTYTDLKLVINGIADGTGQDYYVRFNGDANSNYQRTYYLASDTTEYRSASTSATTHLQLMYVVNGGQVGEPMFCEMDIFDYATTHSSKQMLVNSGSTRNEVGIIGPKWTSSSAISSITIAGSNSFSLSDLVTGSRFTLYGILAGS